MLKKMLSVFLASSMAVALVSCGSSGGSGGSSGSGSGGASGGTVTIKLCHTNPSGCATSDAIQMFADRVTEASEGRLVIEVYADGVMGDDPEINEQIFNGAYMMNYSDPALLESYYPDYSILMAPYFYESYDEIAKVAQSDFGKRLQQECREAGLMVLDGMSGYYGSRQIMSSGFAVNTPADLVGKDFRMPNQSTQLELAAAWGANPVTVSYSETYSALQQGVVDCLENPIGSLYSASMYEVCDYLNMTNHFYAVNGLVMSTQVFESLDAEVKQLVIGHFSARYENEQVLLDEAADFVEYNTQMVVDEEDDCIAAMEEAGCTINRDVDVEAMKEAAMEVYEVHGWSQELIDEAFATLAEIRGE